MHEHPNFQEQPKTPDELLLEQLHLKAGKSIKLIKKHILTSSTVPVGAEIEGILTYDVKIGEPICLDNKTKTVSNITGVGKKEGRIFVKTNTSVYELVTNVPEQKANKKLTMSDLEKEMELYYKKGYAEWDLFNGRVPLEDNPHALFVMNNGLKDGDAIVYFSDAKERTGTIVSDGKNGFSILDSKGNKNGVFAILNTPGNYIKKA